MSILDINIDKTTNETAQTIEQFNSAATVIRGHLDGDNIFNMLDFTRSVFGREPRERWLSFRIGFGCGSLRYGYSKEYSSKMSWHEIRQDLADHWNKELSRCNIRNVVGAVTIFVTKI